jgi:primosomal protein N' (replication factor Y)
MKTIFSIAIKDATRNFDKLYSYQSEEVEEGIEFRGRRVLIPFGKGDKPREGFIIDVLNESEVEQSVLSKIKTILNFKDDKPVVNCELLTLIQYMKNKYICTYYDVLRVMLPVFSPLAKEKTIKAVCLAKSHEEVRADLDANRFNRVQHIRILEMLLENDYIGVSDIMIFAGVSRSVLNTLNKSGYINFINVEVRRDPLSHMEVERSIPHIPTPVQKKVLERCGEILENGDFGEVLLHGVTGSGKTEVYLQLIHKAIEMGREAIVLVPEISLTPQMVSRFKSRFGEAVAVLHSRLSPGERYDQWRAIREGRIKVAVGARSAVFAPFENLGIIVVDEEHEPSYKSEITPKYDAKEIAAKRCGYNKALLVYGSATPSVENYYRAKIGKMELLKMESRAGSSGLPAVSVVDMRKELESGNRSMFSASLKSELQKNIDKKEQSMVFINRRGYASFVLCRTCGNSVACNHCNISMTFHLNSNRLICHYCGYTVPLPQICPGCGSKSIKSFGTGTQKVEEEIVKSFSARVVRMDHDTTTTKNSHENILNKFRDENIDIMIGTQMIAKGHDFPRVTIVGVLAADALLNTGDFRATERTFQLLTQVSGRAGRADLPGKVIIQTYNVDHYSIIHSKNHDYESFYKDEISLREKLMYPPFYDIGILVVSGLTDKRVEEVACKIYEILLDRVNIIKVEQDILILKPLRAPLSRIKDRYRWRLVIKSKSNEKLIELMTKVADEFYSNRKEGDEELSMDINPFNML